MLHETLEAAVKMAKTKRQLEPSDNIALLIYNDKCEFHMLRHGIGQNVSAIVSATILVSCMSIDTFREAIPKFFQTLNFSGRFPQCAEGQERSKNKCQFLE